MGTHSASALLLLIAALLAACGGPGTASDATGPSDEASATAPPAPVVDCLGVVAAKCRSIVADAAWDKPAVPPARIRITCTAMRCDDREGEVEIEIVFADGTRSSYGQGWATAGAAPGVGGPGEPPPEPIELPVPPVCVGIDRDACEQIAADAVMGPDVGLAAIRTITVVCPQGCTEERGEGEVRIGLEDGQEVRSQFGYEGAVGG
jgi:hypothetical protein